MAVETSLLTNRAQRATAKSPSAVTTAVGTMDDTTNAAMRKQAGISQRMSKSLPMVADEGDTKAEENMKGDGSELAE